MKSVFQKMSNRRPPKPASWDIARGNCRFCGAAILKEDGKLNRRMHWHPNCVHEWKIMNDPRVARAYVWDRFKGECQCCGKNTWSYGETWEVDHIDPLFLAAGDLSYWSPGNLQLLCTEPCHREKSKADMELFRKVADTRNTRST